MYDACQEYGAKRLEILEAPGMGFMYLFMALLKSLYRIHVLQGLPEILTMAHRSAWEFPNIDPKKIGVLVSGPPPPIRRSSHIVTWKPRVSTCIFEAPAVAEALLLVACHAARFDTASWNAAGNSKATAAASEALPMVP